jgi:hypothetical protein
MGFSEYENIEIFNKTQSFNINKCENQILSKLYNVSSRIFKMSIPEFLLTVNRI